MKTLAIISGGLDSATLAYELHARGHELALLSFDYAQRHRRELDCARKIAGHLGCPHTIVDLSGLGQLLKGSALTDAVPVPEGHYAAETMRQTVVPNRNAIMLSIAWGIAVAEGFERVAAGVHAGDHYIYPDCRPDFVQQLNFALRTGTDGHRAPGLTLLTPFLYFNKTRIVRLGLSLGVPFGDTWTCYAGGEFACGRCGSCTERLEAFELAGAPDPLFYEPVPA